MNRIISKMLFNSGTDISKHGMVMGAAASVYGTLIAPNEYGGENTSLTRQNNTMFRVSGTSWETTAPLVSSDSVMEITALGRFEKANLVRLNITNYAAAVAQTSTIVVNFNAGVISAGSTISLLGGYVPGSQFNADQINVIVPQQLYEIVVTTQVNTAIAGELDTLYTKLQTLVNADDGCPFTITNVVGAANAVTLSLAAKTAGTGYEAIYNSYSQTILGTATISSVTNTPVVANSEGFGSPSYVKRQITPQDKLTWYGRTFTVSETGQYALVEIDMADSELGNMPMESLGTGTTTKTYQLWFDETAGAAWTAIETFLDEFAA